MKRVLVLAAVLFVFVATLVAPASAANDRQRQAYFSMLAMTEYRQVMQLMQLAPLQLTADQMDGILAVLDENLPEISAKMQAELEALRQRLLRGEQPTASDRKLLREAMTSQIDDDMARQIEQSVEQIQGILTDEQLARLLSGWSRPAAQDRGKYAASVIIPELKDLVDERAEKPVAQCIEELIQAIATATEPPVEEAQEQDLRAFFERVALMTEDELQTERRELHTELEVLLPATFDASQFRIAMHPDVVKRQIVMTFMTASARTLLQEMRDAQDPRER